MHGRQSSVGLRRTAHVSPRQRRRCNRSRGACYSPASCYTAAPCMLDPVPCCNGTAARRRFDVVAANWDNCKHCTVNGRYNRHEPRCTIWYVQRQQGSSKGLCQVCTRKDQRATTDRKRGMHSFVRTLRSRCCCDCI